MKIKELKCTKCNCKVEWGNVELAVTTCSFKRLEGKCHLEQLYNFYSREDAKVLGEPKQLPALLKPRDPTVPWLEPVVSSQLKCDYCDSTEAEFLKKDGCPVHLHHSACELNAQLTKLGRNPFSREQGNVLVVNEKPGYSGAPENRCPRCLGTGEMPSGILCWRCEGFGSVKDIKQYDSNIREVALSCIVKSNEVGEECPKCGKDKSTLTAPCGIECHYDKFGRGKEKVTMHSKAAEFQMEVPDVMVMTITKKGKFFVETKDT